ncbi:MAG: hypothetical protein K0R82_2446, partial [Flavipsychrobacter sp.]|nr:hypothetical protein [Flavipsychrobacter sp.]
MKYLLPVLSFFLCIHATAQNVLLNSDFEQYINCPTGPAQVTINCSDWRAYTTLGGPATPDYFNGCNTGFTVSVPNNFGGNQPAASGNAYVGLVIYDNGGTTNFREYVATSFPALTPGKPYEISMSVSLADQSRYAADGLAVYFYDVGPATLNINGVVPVTPQISFANYGPITNKGGWERLVDTLIADSTYDNLVIGSFLTNSATNADTVATTGSSYAYYFIDSVVLRPLDTLSINFTDDMLCGTGTFLVPYYALYNVFSTGNVFTVQLSDANGSFANPVNIGSKTDTTSGTIAANLPVNLTPGFGYRMRIVSSNIALISNDNGKNIAIGMTVPAKPVITSNSPVCSGSTLALSATSTSTLTGISWTGPNSFSSTLSNPSISNATITASGTYKARAYSYGCVSVDSGIISVVQSPSAVVAGSNSPVCAGDTIKLTATNGINGTSYSWVGPNSFTVNAQNVKISPSTMLHGGDYIVTSTLNGCLKKDTATVVINASPIGVTAWSNSPICEGDTLKLYSSSSTPGVGYSWAGPGSYNSTLQNTERVNTTAAQSGTYILSATLNGCVTKDTAQVTIKPLPAIPVAGSNSPLCEGATLNLTTGNTTAGATYAWAGPGSYTAGTANAGRANTTTAHSGDYVVIALLNGCETKDTTTATIYAFPSVPVIANNSPLCPGDSLGLTAASTAGSVYQWTGPGSYSSIQQNPYRLNVNTSYAGTYEVTAMLNGCSSSNTTTVLVNPTPATPMATSNSPVCPNTPINLFANNLTGASYNWNGPLSYISTQQNPVINNATLLQAGTYSVTATVNGCISLPGTANVVVATPAAPYTAGSNSPICAGGVLNLNVSNMAGASFTWSGPNGFTAGTQNPSLAPVPLNGGGSYSVYATVNGCQYATVSTAVTVNNVSSLGVYPSPNDTLCINNANASFVAVPFNAGTAPQYQWFKNNNLIGGATSITYPATGIADGDSFYCRMTVTGLCADPLVLYSNKVGMTVLPLTIGPSVSITADPGTLLSPWQLVKFTAVATNAGVMPKYQWKRNSQDVIGANSNVWSANNLSNGDTISCMVTSDIWCATPSNAV